MRIIDAHLHLHDNANFNQLAINVGHENTQEHLRDYFKKENIVHGIVMGNEGLNPQEFPDFLSYCVGIDREKLQEPDALQKLEAHLRKKSCVGIKIYAGYCRCYISDPVYSPAYELARTYGKPVAFHMGITAGHKGLLKYSHPLTVDGVASTFPAVQFVICHFGNPWLMDAAAVVDKNENVALDLSGFLEKHIEIPGFFHANRQFIDYIKAAMQFIDEYDRMMYGTDWPLVNMTEYIAFVKELLPESVWDAVFYENAKRIYQLEI
ncbi:MAG: amidohydrolase family protein [Lachnospiraceae bacterium]|jgi:predicted TIM-barrel fold metal-dependent hydrolase